jgi:hypothetical protein
MVEPFVVKWLFGPDGGLEEKLKLVMTSLAEVPVGQMEIIPVGNRLFDDLSAHIAGKGLHISLLSDSFFVLYDGGPAKAYTNHRFQFTSNLAICRVVGLGRG